MRGTYENISRKPTIVSKNREEDFSDNLKLFIEKLVSYYNNEALEMSVLKYQTPELILRFDRKRKLKKLKEI